MSGEWNPPEWKNSPYFPSESVGDVELITTTLSVSYAKSTSDLQPVVILEQMTERFSPEAELWFRLYPTDANFTASVGTLRLGEVREEHLYEVINFSNSKTGKLKRPGAYDIKISPINVMMRQEVDANGKLTVVRFLQEVKYNSITEQLESEVPFYGAITVEYKTLFRILYYKPDFISVPYAGGGISALTIYIGTLFAWKNLTVTTLSVNLSSDKDEKDYEELYRVTSKIVLDPEGVWEYPQNWLSTFEQNKDLPQGSSQRKKYDEGKFDGFTGHTIDPDISLTDDRLHKIGKYNFMGQVFHQMLKPNSRYEYYDPYLFDDSYTPKYTLTWTKPKWEVDMPYQKRLFFEAFWRIDHEGIFVELEKEFPGLKNEGIK